MSDLPVEESKGSAELLDEFIARKWSPELARKCNEKAYRVMCSLAEDVRVRDERIAAALEWAENVLAMNDTVVLRDYLSGGVPDAK